MPSNAIGPFCSKELFIRNRRQQPSGQPSPIMWMSGTFLIDGFLLGPAAHPFLVTIDFFYIFSRCSNQPEHNWKLQSLRLLTDGLVVKKKKINFQMICDVDHVGVVVLYLSYNTDRIRMKTKEVYRPCITDGSVESLFFFSHPGCFFKLFSSSPSV